MYSETTRSINVTVQPFYLEDRSSPAEDRYVWAYHVRIENRGQETVQLRNRHWKITDSHGRMQEVRGPGVVGEQPVLGPGESFEYTSGTPLPTPPASWSAAIRWRRRAATASGSRFQPSRSTARISRSDSTEREGGSNPPCAPANSQREIDVASCRPSRFCARASLPATDCGAPTDPGRGRGRGSNLDPVGG